MLDILDMGILINALYLDKIKKYVTSQVKEI